jgi:hypothetical protein
MLRRVLREIEALRGPINLYDLARRLEIEPGALEGMIDFWIWKGRLKDNRSGVTAAEVACSGAVCSRSCPGPQDCPFVVRMPRTLSVVLSPQDKGTPGI